MKSTRPPSFAVRHEEVTAHGRDQLELDRGPDDDSHRPLRAGHQPHQVGRERPFAVDLRQSPLPLRFEIQRPVARFAGERQFAASPHHAAISQRLGQREIEPRDGGRLPLEQAGDDRLVGARRQRARNSKSFLGQGGRQFAVGDARFDDGDPVATIDALDRLHAAEVDDDRLGRGRNRVAVEVRGPGADRHQRRHGRVGPFHQRLDLALVRRPDDEPRTQRLAKTFVAGEFFQGLGIVENVVLADDGRQLPPLRLHVSALLVRDLISYLKRRNLSQRVK